MLEDKSTSNDLRRNSCSTGRGTSSAEQLARWAKREAELKARGGTVFLPDRESAVPPTETIAAQGLRTIPPRENCGNAEYAGQTSHAFCLFPFHRQKPVPPKRDPLSALMPREYGE